MNKLNLILCATLVVAPAGALAADFEGTVTMKMSGPRGTPQALDFSLAQGKSRIDVVTPDGMNASIIHDHGKKEMVMLMPQQRMYIIQPIPPATERPAASAGRGDSSVEKTGETEKILGYDCTKYISKSEDGTVSEMWVTDQLGTFSGMSANPMGGMGGRRGGAPASPAWEEALKGKDVFPLRVVSKGRDGKESFRMEATAVAKKSLPASTFAPPADFQKFDMQGMMRGAMPGMRPPGGD